MSTSARIHLSGAGSRDDDSAIYGPFLDDATAHARGRPPRIVVLLWAPTHEAGLVWHQEYIDDFNRIRACKARVVQLSPGRPLHRTDLTEVDGLVVGGGHTPGYHEAITPLAAEIRGLVGAGVPYCGISAGSMIAAANAIIGGWKFGGIPVIPEESGESIEEVTMRPGLGLVDRPVDVHVAQFGTLGRPVAVVERGLAERAVGIDEETALIVDGDDLEVVGHGSVWFVERHGDGAISIASRTTTN